MEMSTLVRVLRSVLQRHFKPTRSYQEQLSAAYTLPFLLNFWFLKRNFFCPLSRSAYSELFLHWCEKRRVEKKKKRLTGLRENWDGDERQKPWWENSSGQQSPFQSLGSGAAECESPFFFYKAET